MKYGFLGAGHLASAVVFGLIKAGVQPDDIFVNSPASARSLADKTGIHYAEEKQLIGDSDLIVLAFLPEQLKKNNPTSASRLLSKQVDYFFFRINKS